MNKELGELDLIKVLKNLCVTSAVIEGYDEKGRKVTLYPDKNDMDKIQAALKRDEPKKVIFDDEVRRLMLAFPHGAFINANADLILYPKSNLSFSLKDVETKEDLICKLFEWCSRHCFKSLPFRSERRNKQYHNEILDSVNYYLKTNFSQNDMDIIYTYLGNGIHHELTKKFVRSGFDLDVLRGDEEWLDLQYF